MAHQWLGIAALLYWVGHSALVIATRQGIKPFSNLGWLPEQLLVALSLGLAGAWMVASGRRKSVAQSLAAAGLLAVVAGLEYERYFTGFLAFFAFAGLADGLCFAVVNRRRVPAPLAYAIACLFAAGLAFASVFATLAAASGAPRKQERWRWGTWSATVASLASAAPCEDVRLRLGGWGTTNAEKAALLRALDAEAKAIAAADLRDAYCRALLDDLHDKELAKQHGVVLTGQDIARHAIAYERFRLETYLRAGVAPKRYFGFFDEQGDTAEHERVLRRTVIDSVPLVNCYAEKEKIPVRVTEMEVAVTFLAEGGALLLTERQFELERVHPVRGIGLDNYRPGFVDSAPLVGDLDRHLGTHLGKLVVRVGGKPLLLRPMTFREAILGTALMYLHQKARAARLVAQAPGRTALSDLPLDAQFVTGSLVYNSGILFSTERVAQILDLSTGPYLAQVNRDNEGKRTRLPLYVPEEARRRLIAGERLPEQLTSWSAVYHVVQRYGAWMALRRFSTVFDEEGAFRDRRP